MSHEDMMFGHAGVLVLVNDSCFHDPELRTSIKISGLQGPVRVKEKREKERNELRDLVISFF